jgi:hypothetical protein
VSALFAGHTASFAALGLALLLVPLIAFAAKLTYDQARRSARREKRRSAEAAMDERIKTKLEATIWPD